jgi:hypothetical protein
MHFLRIPDRRMAGRHVATIGEMIDRVECRCGAAFLILEGNQ